MAEKEVGGFCISSEKFWCWLQSGCKTIGGETGYVLSIYPSLMLYKLIVVKWQLVNTDNISNNSNVH